MLITILLIQGLTAIGGGGALMADPSGAVLGLSQPLLLGSPFADYLIPGLILFAVLGLFPLIVAYGVLRGRRWAHFGAIADGLGLAIWIAVQIAMIGYQPRPPLQAVYGAVAVAILLLALSPGVRRYFANPEAPPRSPG